MFCGFYAALKYLENTHCMFNGINVGFVSGFFAFYGLIQLFLFVSGSNTCTDCVYYNNPTKDWFHLKCMPLSNK